ncbi:MAG: chemotaxis protein CheB [Phototrophicaceae bacterium]
MGKDIRIILAEDSPTVRHHLRSIIEETPDMQVVGIAKNGIEAIKMVEDLRPDVVSMDINMPDLDGLEATRHIMAHTPTPIVMVSGLLAIDIQLSLQAIEAGALAVIDKPPNRVHPDFTDKQVQLVKTLRAMAGVKVISRRKSRFNHANATGTNQSEQSASDTNHPKPEIIVIGASTGGPSALLHFIKEMPHNLSVPIVIVQHMPDEFITGFAQWLAKSTPLRVLIAHNNLVLDEGSIVIAPGNANLSIVRKEHQLIAQLSTDTAQSRYMPSVDILFTSVAKVIGKQTLAIILTGMGDDGAKGLLAIRQAGGTTFVQDEDSAIVFGMPQAAIRCGAVQKIIPLANLATKVKKLL